MALSLISAYLIYLITCLLMKWTRFSFRTFFRCHVSLLSLSSIYSVPQILPTNVFESEWISVIAAENFLFRISNKKKILHKNKKRKLISPFQFPILFSLSPLPILAFENIRCRKCLSSNFLKSYHFKANINNKNKIKNNKRIWEASFERKKYTATMKKDTTFGNFYYNTSSISAQIYRAAGWYSRVFASFYYNKDDSRHQRIFSVFTEGLLFTHTI